MSSKRISPRVTSRVRAPASIGERVRLRDGHHPFLHDADIFENAGDLPGHPAGGADDLHRHRQRHGNRADADMAVAPQHDREGAGAGDQPGVEHRQREPEQRVEAQRFMETVGMMVDRLAHIGIFILGAREQLHRHDVGVGVDDAPGQQRAGFRHHLRLVAHARHEDAQHHHIAAEPQQHRHRQPAIGRGEQDQRAGAVDQDEPDGGEQRDETLADRRPGLHHARGDAAREVVLEEGPRLARDVPVVLPADPVGDVGGNGLVHHQLLDGVGRRPQQEQHQGHGQQHRP